jgi:hypothetical protein
MKRLPRYLSLCDAETVALVKPVADVLHRSGEVCSVSATRTDNERAVTNAVSRNRDERDVLITGANGDD